MRDNDPWEKEKVRWTPWLPHFFALRASLGRGTGRRNAKHGRLPKLKTQNWEPSRWDGWKSQGRVCWRGDLHRRRTPISTWSSLSGQVSTDQMCVRKWPDSREELPGSIRGLEVTVLSAHPASRVYLRTPGTLADGTEGPWQWGLLSPR